MNLILYALIGIYYFVTNARTNISQIKLTKQTLEYIPPYGRKQNKQHMVPVGVYRVRLGYSFREVHGQSADHYTNTNILTLLELGFEYVSDYREAKVLRKRKYSEYARGRLYAKKRTHPQMIVCRYVSVHQSYV